LIYLFIAAFAKLSGVSQLHEDAEEIRQLYTREEYLLSPVQNSNALANVILIARDMRQVSQAGMH
jgi:hypothetical protein